MAARALRHQRASARGARGFCRPRRRGRVRDRCELHARARLSRRPRRYRGKPRRGGHPWQAPPYGLTAPAGGAAIAMQRYMHLYGATSDQLAAVPIAMRNHALTNPRAIMKEPLTLAAHQSARMVVDPLRLFDCCLISDGAAVVLIARG